jgi:hypothetical protein
MGVSSPGLGPLPPELGSSDEDRCRQRTGPGLERPAPGRKGRVHGGERRSAEGDGPGPGASHIVPGRSSSVQGASRRGDEPARRGHVGTSQRTWARPTRPWGRGLRHGGRRTRPGELETRTEEHMPSVSDAEMSPLHGSRHLPKRFARGLTQRRTHLRDREEIERLLDRPASFFRREGPPDCASRRSRSVRALPRPRR